MTIKIVAIVIFLAIVAGLGTALFHLVRSGGEEQSRKTAKALTFRIGLSLALFILLFLALATGLLRPSGIGAGIQAHSVNNNQPASNP